MHKKFEYLGVIHHPYTGRVSQIGTKKVEEVKLWHDLLNDLGSKGWELCSEYGLVSVGFTSGVVSTLKREILGTHPLQS